VNISEIDYSELDRPEILAFLFHPNPNGEVQGEATGERLWSLNRPTHHHRHDERLPPGP